MIRLKPRARRPGRIPVIGLAVFLVAGATSVAQAGPALAPDDGLPALTPARMSALETAIDDRDHQDSAFQALMQGMIELDPTSIDPGGLEPVGRSRALEFASDPDRHRGVSALIVGRLEQSHPLPRPHDAIVEWFVRLPDGHPVAVYVPRVEDLEPGARVRVAARFYKRLAGSSRDGTVSNWAAFGGRALGDAPSPDARPTLVVLVVVLAVAWWLLRRLVARPAGLRTRRIDRATLPKDEDLPTDPLDALDELARRSDDSGRKAPPP